MSKRFRLFLILFFVVVGAIFIYPTISWYFLTPQEEKDVATYSREKIREVVNERAATDLKMLQDLAKNDPDAVVPDGFEFVLNTAKQNFQDTKAKDELEPSEWTIKNTLKYGFKNKQQLMSLLEAQYRDEVFSLKSMKDRILKLGLDLQGGMSVVVEADVSTLEEKLGYAPTEAEKDDAVQRAMEILTSRIDMFGLTEPQIRIQDNYQIGIEVPGEYDPEVVNSFLTGKGSLAFHIVDDEAMEKMENYKLAHPEENIKGLYWQPADTNLLPAGLVVRPFVKKDAYGDDVLVSHQVVKEEVGLDGSHIQSATVTNDPVTGMPQVVFELSSEGGEIFYKLTSTNVGKTMAVVMSDKIKAGARIQTAIRDRVRITGFDRQEAEDLARVLRTAALPVELIRNAVVEVGPSLGEDSITSGIWAIGIGFGLVILFMLAFYKGSGLVADLALILNLFFITSILSVFGLTLTLTSIAGIILTVGMAVDANVIIFERIKEEYRLGKSAAASVKAGFAKAFWTVFDANITTFIAALFLSQIGSGPIQGFAVTLAVGIVTSMFTALFVSRLMFDFGTDVLKSEKLSITWRKN